MDRSIARRWPWPLIAAGVGIAVYYGSTLYDVEARERELRRLQDARGLKIRCGTEKLRRRMTRSEYLAGLTVGLQLATAGVLLLRRALWKRRGAFARVLWAALLLGGSLLQVRMGYLIHEVGFPPDRELLLWAGALSPAFILPLVALSGCVLAREAAVTPASPRTAPPGS